MELEFTGERVVPGKVEPYLYFEHISRYCFAMQLIKPSDHVLDLGCGAGYGTFEVARAAESAIGVDISPETIEYAKERYVRPNLGFMVMDCSNLIFEPNSFDLAVSFEVIEHVPDVQQYMLELKKVLKSDGRFIVSTPNKRVYTDPYEYRNPYHIKEFYYGEFADFLRVYFKHVAVFFQGYIHGLAIRGKAAYDQVGHIPLERGDADPESASYFIAVCSDAEFVEPISQHFTYESQ